jgi:Fe2+ or Zn2+ uptake regulation protein
MSKYNEIILNVLSKSEIKSTNEVLKEVENKAKKVVNWHALYRILMELQTDGKIERLKAKAGFFWRKK